MWIFFTLLAVICWSVLNTIDSLLVRHFESRPLVISWTQSTISVPILLFVGYMQQTQNDWALLLFFIGAVTYMGDLCFWRILSLADASSSNFVGVFVAIIMTGMGVGFFGDVLTISQMIGVLLVFVGIATLSFSKLHALSGTALFLMALAGAFYSPFYLTQKWVLSHGETFFSTFFWMILGREFFAITLSSLLSTSRRQILASLPSRSLRFYLFNFVSITLFLFAMYCISRAYAVGSATYVSILGNIQPFVVIAVAWVFTILTPELAPRELLTARSLRVKVLSFSLVFLGLALLSFSH